jgi:ferritin
MAVPAVPAAVVSELQRQLNYELAAAHAYYAMSLWCEDQVLKGMAKFFKKQAEEEREHAEKFIEHLLDRGVLPELSAVSAPRARFENIIDLAKTAQLMEKNNTTGIHACYAAALQSTDYPAQVLLHWFINEQVEEEAWCSELVTRAERANCAGGLAELDRHVMKYLAEDEDD